MSAERKGHRGGMPGKGRYAIRDDSTTIEGNGMKCPNCGAVVDSPGSRVCSVCNAYQPRVRRKAYIGIIIVMAWLAFMASPLEYILYAESMAMAIAFVLILVWEVRARAKERRL
jgi:hypothetical protein